MDIGIAGIKCDAEGCGYEKMDIEWGNTPEEILATNDKFLNMPCPECGASLLTPEDHASVKMMVALAPELTALEDELKLMLPEDHPGLEQVKVGLKMNGTGSVNVDGVEKL